MKHNKGSLKNYMRNPYTSPNHDSHVLPSERRKWLSLTSIFCILTLIPGLLFLLLTISLTQLHYNDQGRHFDASEGVVYHSQSIISFSMITAFFLLPSLILLITFIYSRLKQRES